MTSNIAGVWWIFPLHIANISLLTWPQRILQNWKCFFWDFPIFCFTDPILSHLLLRWNEMWDREIQFWIRNQLHPRTFLISGEFFLDFIPEIDKERGIRLRKGFCAFFPSLVSLVFSCSPVTLSHITWYLQLKIKNNTFTHRWKAIFLETQGAKSAVNKLLEEN